MHSIPAVSRMFLIPEFDFLAQFDYTNTKDRENQVCEIRLKIGEFEHVTNTRIILPVEPALDAVESTDTFTIIRIQPGRMREVLHRLRQLPDIRAVQVLLEEADLFVQASNGGLKEIATLLQDKIGKIKWISDAEPLIPHLELDQYTLPICPS